MFKIREKIKEYEVIFFFLFSFSLSQVINNIKMGCNLSNLSGKNRYSEKQNSSSNSAIKKETIEIIQDSWKKYNEVNTLAEHGINMVIRYSIFFHIVKIEKNFNFKGFLWYTPKFDIYGNLRKIYKLKRN
jgi:hypothetical protein